MTKIFFYLGVLLASLFSFAATGQNNDFEKDIEKMLAINGSTASYDLAFDQIIAQFKMMKPEAPDEVWEKVRTDVFDKEIATLNKQLVPLYKKNFSHDDVKGLIKFYESPLGKKMTEASAKIAAESMQLAQTWGMGLGSKISTFLQEKGY